MAEEARSSRYRHSPLQHARNLRVLEVKPGEYGSDIHFVLREQRLRGLEPLRYIYHALSYVWGPPLLSETIISADGYLTTTPSLYAALQRFRATDRTVALWVDAVCINQEDLDERGQQVAIMHSIYTTSASVLIWLGDATKIDEEAFDFILQFTDKHIKGSLEDAMSELDAQDLSIWETNEKVENLMKTYLHLANKIQNSGELNDNIANALTHFFGRDWFVRVWTVQEVASARAAVVKCGSLTLDYDILENFAYVWRCMGMQTWLCSTVAQSSALQFGGLYKFRRKNKTEDSLVSVAHQLRSRQATDSRDTLYGLLGLASIPQPLPYAPSYMVTTEQLYLDFAAKEIKESRTLEVFQYCFFNEDSHLSSWVPDWRIHRPSYEMISNTNGRFCAYRHFHPRHTSEYAHAPWNQSDEEQKRAEEADDALWDTYTTIYGSSLVVRAFIFDTPDQVISMRYMEFIEESLQVTEKSAFYPDAARQREAWWRTFIGDRRGHSFQAEDEFEDSVVDFVMTVAKWVQQGNDESRRVEDFPTMMEVERRFRSTATNRQFCRTRHGKIGWIPDTCKEGDVLAIIFGSPVSILLRPKGDSYFMIGQCYIHDVMNGGQLGGVTVERTEFETVQHV